jgi:thiamine pyrophosphokinase
MHFVVFSGGSFTNGKVVKKTLARFDKTIAVDSGASHCLKLNLVPDYMIGDFDSIDKKTLKFFGEKGSRIVPLSSEKDQTDTEKALDLALKMGASTITILAGIAGTRTDHLIGNILLLGKNKYKKVQIKFADGDQEIHIANNHIQIDGKPGDLVSFIPLFNSVTKMHSSGLKYNLSSYKLSIQGNHGISNELTAKRAKAVFKNKTLLVIHTRS